MIPTIPKKIDRAPCQSDLGHRETDSLFFLSRFSVLEILRIYLFFGENAEFDALALTQPPYPKSGGDLSCQPNVPL